MIYDIINLKVGDYVKATDNIYLPKAIIPRHTMARVCATAGYGGHIGLEFQIHCAFAGGHDCFGAGRPGYCAWIRDEDVSTFFDYVSLVTKLDVDCHHSARYYVNPFSVQQYLYDDWRKKNRNHLSIDKVIFNDPATIVFWKDGSKTVVKAENEPFDKEKGLAMAISKKALGNKGNYYDTFKEHIPDSRIVYHHKLTDDERLIPVPRDTKCIFTDNDTRYIELPDGLRLIYRDGKYVGWYVAG